MATAATLSIKILADISDLEQGLSKSDRAVLRLADSMTDAGKRMAIGITAPLVAIGAAFAKSSADNVASAMQMQRAFGESEKSMNSFIGSLMKSVPASDTELRGLAVSTDTLLRSMGMTAPAAERMTESVMKLAATSPRTTTSSSVWHRTHSRRRSTGRCAGWSNSASQSTKPT